MDREHEQQAAVPEEKTKKKKFRRVCVFCGSSPGKRSSYQAAAVQLGQQLVERGMDLVYGGGSVGLMVPKAVLPLELIGELKPVAGMHIHTKPVGLLNVDGYYDPLLAFVDKAVQEGFVTPAERSIIVDANTPHDLLDKLQVQDDDDDDSSSAPDHIA